MPDAPSCFSMSLQQVADACAGSVAAKHAALLATGVSTDTRDLVRGDLFVALKGVNHNGHDYVGAAFDAGAAAALVSDPRAVPEGRPAVVAADTLVAFGRIASAHRLAQKAIVAAITGSVAKTTTKGMLSSVMAGVGETLSAPGTHNNEIGVPQTLVRLCGAHRFCVLELAMRGPGEIAYLAEIVRPDVGVITNIGESHVGRLGSRDAIARAKAELLDWLPEDGVAVLNADDFFFPLFRELAECKVASFGMLPPADFHPADVVSRGLEGASFTLVSPIGTAPVTLSVPGLHNVANSLASAAAAHAMGAGLQQIVDGLSRHTGTPMRMEHVPGMAGALIINDAYNASPDSVGAALELLAETEGRRIFVFGDMLELGDLSEQAHHEVGKRAAAAGVAWLIGVGELAALAAEEAAAAGVRTTSVADAAEAADVLRGELAADDVVLVKGSRGIGLERVVEAVRADG